MSLQRDYRGINEPAEAASPERHEIAHAQARTPIEAVMQPRKPTHGQPEQEVIDPCPVAQCSVQLLVPSHLPGILILTLTSTG